MATKKGEPMKGGRPFTGANDPRRHKEGRPKTPDDVKAARKLTQIEFEKAVSKIISMKRNALEKLVESQEANVFDQLIATIWLKGIKDSAKSELNYFVERFLGKVADNHNFQGNVHAGIVDWLSTRKALPAGEKEVEEIKDEFEDV